MTTASKVLVFYAFAIVLLALWLALLAGVLTLAFSVPFYQAFCGVVVAYALLSPTRQRITPPPPVQN